MYRALRKPFATGALVILSSLFGADYAAAPRSLSPPFVEFAGCSAVREGPVCEMGEGRDLRVWIKAADTLPFTLLLDGSPLPFQENQEKIACQGGARMRISLPAKEHILSVTMQDEGVFRTFQLFVQSQGADRTLDEMERLRKAGQLEAAIAFCEQALRAALPRGQRARLLSRLARLSLAKGATAAAMTTLREAITLHHAEGRVSDEAEDRMTLVYAHIFHGRSFPAARQELSALALLEPMYPEGRAMVAYYGAMLASETGDFRAALSLLRVAADTRERLGMEKLGLEIKQMHADVLQRMGRAREAEALLITAEQDMPTKQAPCRRASLLNDIGYNALLLAQQNGHDETRLLGSVSALGRALDLYAESGPCPKPRNRANALTNLALASLHRGLTDQARQYVAQAASTFPDADTRMTTEWSDIEGRIWLAEGRADRALFVYEDAYAEAARAAEPEGLFVAELGRARSLAALGLTNQAADAYTRAEEVSQSRSLLVPLGEGRATFLGRFEEGAKEHVDLLLDVDPKAALAAARRARGQMLSTLQWSHRLPPAGTPARARWEEVLSKYRAERQEIAKAVQDDWKLAADELSSVITTRREHEATLETMLDEALVALGFSNTEMPKDALQEPREGELLLVYFPIQDGLAGFAWTQRGVVVHRLSRVDTTTPPSQLAEALLLPFEAQINQAKRIRFVTQGPLERVDLHGLPWKGAPLLAQLPVVYGVDLPVRGAQSDNAPPQGPAVAVVVGDPRGDLPAARREAERVASELLHRGIRSLRLSKGEASHAALRDALEDPHTFFLHYAGHGFFAGRDGWESSLPLAGGAEFSVGDVLSLVHVPRSIVLSGCETGRTEGDVPVEGLGLGQAFVVAGATAVVVTTRPLDDRLAERVMAALYKEPTQDLAQALRQAVLRAANEDPSSDWTSFRVLVP